MKQVFYLMLCLVTGINMVMAQTHRVTGTVISGEDNEPIIGASVVIKGTMNGTVTDLDGKFVLNVPTSSKQLVISFVGMRQQEVDVKDGIRIIMSSDSQKLDEVVVTAMGISREKKSLGYALQEVKSDELTNAGHINVTSALEGKVAGVQVTASGGQVGASSRIVIRGNSSLGDNQPLIVVDGIPISNDQIAASSVDYGSGINDINPNDIESISVLKGGSAALYGMRAGNGVILITTKSGKGKNGVQINYDGEYTFDHVMNLPKYQNKYGQGYTGSEYDYNYGGYYDDNKVFHAYKDESSNYADFVNKYCYSFNGTDNAADESWGPRLDAGLKIPQFDSPIGSDGKRTATDWISHPDNVKSFFQTGYTMNHVISLTSNTEKSTTRASLGYRDQTGYIPNTDQSRYSAQLNTKMSLGKYVDYDLATNFTYTKSNNLPMTEYNAGNVLQSITQWFGRQVNMQSLKDNWNTVDSQTGLPYSWNPFYHQDPYYTVHKNLNEYTRNRFFGKSSLWLKPTDWLKFEGRLGYDFYDAETFSKTAYTTDDPTGFFDLRDQKQTEVNADFVAYFNKNVGNLNINLLAGANYRDVRWKYNRIYSDQLTVPELYTISNAESSTIEMDHSHIRSNSVYGNLSLGYKNFLYSDISARNDWSSTISDPFFYPSVSLSFIPTAAFNKFFKETPLNYLKIRGGWAKIGNATTAYQTAAYYTAATSTIGNVTQFYLPTTYPPKGLKPESVETWELGLEGNLFNSRLGFDLAYYHKKTTDEIMKVTTSSATGYSAMLINAGEITNRGLEVQLNGTPIKTKDWTWTVTLNWSKDKSKIVELYKDPTTGQSLDQYELGHQWSTYVYAKPGESWGSIYGYGMVSDGKGNYIIGSDGLPETKYEKLGDVTPDWLASLRNEVTWKNLSAGFMLDYRKGGDIFSVSSMWYAYTGIADFTAKGDIRERPIIVGKDVATDYSFVKEDGTANDITTDAHAFFYSYYYNRQFSTFEGSFLKLREMHLTYNVPQYFLKKIDGFVKAANLSVIGTNVAILWLSSTNKAHIDPESTSTSGSNSSSSNYAVGLESVSYMPTRSIGFKIGLTF